MTVVPESSAEVARRVQLEVHARMIFAGLRSAGLRTPDEWHEERSVELWSARFVDVHTDLLTEAVGGWVSRSKWWPTLKEFGDLVDVIVLDRQRAERESADALDLDTRRCVVANCENGWVDQTPGEPGTHTLVPCSICNVDTREYWRRHRNLEHIKHGGCAGCRPGSRKAS